MLFGALVALAVVLALPVFRLRRTRQAEASLRESRARLAAIVESAMDAMIAFDDELRISVFNRAAEKTFGCSRDDAIGASVDRFVPGVARGAGVAGRLTAVRANAEEFPIDASISSAVIAGRTLHTIVLRDVTEKRRIEDARRESDERFRLVADTAPVMLWMTDPDQQATYFNRSWLEFTGRPADAEAGLGYIGNLHPDDAARCREACDRAYAAREPFTIEYRLRRFDGEYRWVLGSGAPRYLPDGSFAGFVGSTVDVTTQKRARAALADLSRKLTEAHESERTRVARELHDDIGQRMAVLNMDIDALERSLPRSLTELRAQLQTLSEHVRELARDTQAISHRLHSSKLDYLGLTMAASRFCRELEERQHVEIAFACHDVPDDVPRDVATCIFRVLQEAVTNAVKHAGVNNVSATLRGDGHELRLEVADQGRGFEPEAAMRGGGLGLISMQERVGLMKGALAIVSRVGQGTTVSVRIPLSDFGHLALAAPA